MWRFWSSARRLRELDPREAYALWAPSYPALPHNGLMELEQRTLLGLLPDDGVDTALDVGCGSGRYLRLLRERGALRVFGCDLTPAMLLKARTLEPGLALADAGALPFADGSFDLVLAALVVGHCPDLARVLGEFSRVLRPGGTLAYSDIHPAGTLAGWQRTFEDASGRRHAVRQHLHLHAEHLRGLHAAGLALDALEEPRGGQAGRYGDWPALLAIRARKPA